MGKAQGAPNAFLPCSLCHGEGEEIGRFLGKYLRSYLFFGKEEQNHSDSNHFGHSVLLNSGAVTRHASQPGISHANAELDVPPSIFMDLFKEDTVF